jgi:hypothetical protein
MHILNETSGGGTRAELTNLIQKVLGLNETGIVFTPFHTIPN